MNMRWSHGLALAAGITLAAGCGGNPIAGDWIASITQSDTTTLNINLSLNADGSATMRFDRTAPAGITCESTALTFSGARWSTSGTTLTITGMSSCSGQPLACMGGSPPSISCTDIPASSTLSSGSYTLSMDGRRLTLPVTIGSMTSVTFSRTGT